jgi:K+-transporting ATPase ATPase C chain
VKENINLERLPRCDSFTQQVCVRAAPTNLICAKSSAEMRKNMIKFFKGIKKPFIVTLSLLLICGLGYPLLLTGISQVFFPRQAGGSMIMIGGQAMGSELVGQNFTDNRFMKNRPSAVGYNTYTREDKELGNYSGVASGSNNYGPTNPKLTERVKKDLDVFMMANPTVKQEDIPTDLLTASGSGLDPHISPASAIIQIPALVESTGLSSDTLEEIVENNTKGKVLGIFGEETVNVLMVNLDIAKELGIIN